MASADSVLHDHTYCAKVDGASQQDVETPELQDKLNEKLDVYSNNYGAKRQNNKQWQT